MRHPSLALATLALSLTLALTLLTPRPARALWGRGGVRRTHSSYRAIRLAPARASAPIRWAWELVQRTSAPARLHPTVVRADDPSIVDAPFLYWSSDTEVAPLTNAEITGLRRFFALGGILLVDDAGVGMRGEMSAFGKSARREIARVLPDSTRVAL